MLYNFEVVDASLNTGAIARELTQWFKTGGYSLQSLTCQFIKVSKGAT